MRGGRWVPLPLLLLTAAWAGCGDDAMARCGEGLGYVRPKGALGGRGGGAGPGDGLGELGAAYVPTDAPYQYFADAAMADVGHVVPVREGGGLLYRVARCGARRVFCL